MAKLLHPSDQLGVPPLDALQQGDVLPVLGTLELDAEVQAGSHLSRAEGKNQLQSGPMAWNWE